MNRNDDFSAQKLPEPVLDRKLTEMEKKLESMIVVLKTDSESLELLKNNLAQVFRSFFFSF